MNDKLKTLTRGIVDVSPLMIPVFPFGIIYGVIGMELGIGPYMTLGLSIIIFGGASQIVLLQLFSGGASSLVILSSVGAVNSRHLLYGAVLSEYLSTLKLTWKIILSYVMVDQAFAVSNTYLKKNSKGFGTAKKSGQLRIQECFVLRKRFFGEIIFLEDISGYSFLGLPVVVT